MIIIREKKDQLNKEFFLPVEGAWSHAYSDSAYCFDLNEQVYKKRKVYFHISTKLLRNIKAQTGLACSVPAVFYAQDAATCINYYKIATRGTIPFAYLHRCLNIRSMQLFNPLLKNDKKMLFQVLTADEQLLVQKIMNSWKLLAGKNERHWLALENKVLMNLIYKKTKFDGIVLDFAFTDSDYEKRYEGFCLFDRAENIMKVVDAAKIDNINDKNLDITKLWYEYPQR